MKQPMKLIRSKGEPITLNDSVSFPLLHELDLGYALYNHHGTFFLPTQGVIRDPKQTIRMKEGRIFRTELYVRGDRALVYAELEKLDALEGKRFAGTWCEDEILLCEVWGDNGDDGHIRFRFRGWAFVKSSDLKKKLKDENQPEQDWVCDSTIAEWLHGYNY